MLFPLNFFIAIFLLFHNCCSINILLLYVTVISAPKVPNKDKNEIFECGFSTFSDTKNAFNVQYYLTAVLFLIFDVSLHY